MARGLRNAISYENFSITLENDKRVFIDGCRSILKYESDCVRIRLYRRNLRVYGSELTLKSFSQKELCVSGKIAGVALED